MLLLYNPNHCQDVKHCFIDFYDPFIVAIYLKSSALNTLSLQCKRLWAVNTAFANLPRLPCLWGQETSFLTVCEKGLRSRLQGPPGLVSGRPNLTALRSPERPRAGAGVHHGRPGGRGPGPG